MGLDAGKWCGGCIAEGMTSGRPTLEQALTDDRLAYERARAQAEAVVPGVTGLSERLRIGMGLTRLEPRQPGVLPRRLR